MMDEFPLTNDAKEQLCFVSQDLQHDMRIIQQRCGTTHPHLPIAETPYLPPCSPP